MLSEPYPIIAPIKCYRNDLYSSDKMETCTEHSTGHWVEGGVLGGTAFCLGQRSKVSRFSSKCFWDYFKTKKNKNCLVVADMPNMA